MTGLELTRFFLLAVLLAVAVFTDLKERRIPNKVTVSGLLAGVLVGAFVEEGVPVAALLGAALALLVAFPLVVLGGVGAGDAKLLTAVGAFVGPGGLLPVLVYGGIAGGVVAFVSLLRRGALLGVLVNTRRLLIFWLTWGRHGQRVDLRTLGAETVPYGVAIAAGAMLAWFFPFSLGGSL